MSETMHVLLPENAVRLGWNGSHYTAFKADANRSGYLLYRICVQLKRRKE